MSSWNSPEFTRRREAAELDCVGESPPTPEAGTHRQGVFAGIRKSTPRSSLALSVAGRASSASRILRVGLAEKANRVSPTIARFNPVGFMTVLENEYGYRLGVDGLRLRTIKKRRSHRKFREETSFCRNRIAAREVALAGRRGQERHVPPKPTPKPTSKPTPKPIEEIEGTPFPLAGTALQADKRNARKITGRKQDRVRAIRRLLGATPVSACWLKPPAEAKVGVKKMACPETPKPTPQLQ